MKVLFILFVALILVSCKGSQKTNELDFGVYIAKGDIHDSVFNGLIKFYDKSSGHLISEGIYDSGVQNGLYKEYDSNGKIRTVTNYTNGLENGYTLTFDSLSRLTGKISMFYGLPVGERTSYRNGEPFLYNFFSLENKNLFSINYDSSKGKAILDISDGFFYMNDYNREDSSVEYHIYNVNPPHYKFNYSLVLVDTSLKIKKEIYPLKDLHKPWFEVEVNFNDAPPDNFYAIKLFVEDSTLHKDCTMIKVLR